VLSTRPRTVGFSRGSRRSLWDTSPLIGPGSVVSREALSRRAFGRSPSRSESGEGPAYDMMDDASTLSTVSADRLGHSNARAALGIREISQNRAEFLRLMETRSAALAAGVAFDRSARLSALALAREREAAAQERSRRADMAEEAAYFQGSVDDFTARIARGIPKMALDGDPFTELVVRRRKHRQEQVLGSPPKVQTERMWVACASG
jgi:hypothetical protein